MIETRDGKLQTLHLKDDAVFEDLKPRIADLNGDGHDDVIVVKSYLKRGSALAVIAERKGRYEIVAETPPLGAPHRWLDPAGIADFTGDQQADIALVRQPHVDRPARNLELAQRRLEKSRRAARHRQSHRRHARDRHGRGRRLRRRRYRRHRHPLARPHAPAHLSFAPKPREIASVALPAKAATNLGLLKGVMAPAVALGLADGSLVVVQRSE